jgi:hypothetical protein
MFQLLGLPTEFLMTYNLNQAANASNALQLFHVARLTWGPHPQHGFVAASFVT